MVKLTGPALGQGASGALAESVIFSSSKGRSYLKSFKRPKQPRTKPQVSMRVAMTFLAQQWHLFAAPVKATWQPLATARNISPFNAYQANNLQRWRDMLGPSAAYPPSLVGALPVGITFNVTGLTRRIRVNLSVNTLNQGWGFIIHHVPNGTTRPTWQDPLIAFPTPTPTAYVIDITPLDPGVYWLYHSKFTWTGLYGIVDVWRTCTVLP